MKKLVLVVLLISSFSFAQTAGESGLSFMKIGFGARNIAMGDIGVVSANDVTSLYYNPSALSQMERPELTFTHNEWIQDTRSEFFGASFRLIGLPLAVGVNTTTVSDIEVRNTPGEAISKFNANYFVSSLSTGFGVIENISAGITLKYIYEGMLAEDSQGWGMDLGATYTSPIKGLTFGTVIKNIGSMNKLRNEETKLPKELRLGALYSFSVSNINSEIAAGTEFQKYLDTDDIHINFGGEILYNNLLALRLGYQTNYESKGLTSGVGLKWGSLSFDYAFTPFNYNLGTAHIISLKFRF